MSETPKPTDSSDPAPEKPAKKPPVGWWIFAIFLVGLSLVIVRQHIKNGYDPGTSWGSAITGGLIVSFVFTGIVPLVWWAICRFDRKRASGPVLTWAILATLVGGAGISGAILRAPDGETTPPQAAAPEPAARETATAAYRHRYMPPGCEFSASFPAQPAMKEVRNALAYSLEEAELTTGASLLRAGCVVTGAETIRDEAQLTAFILEFAKESGLENIDHAYSEYGDIITVGALGTKTEAGRAVTYEFLWHVGAESTLTITVRGSTAGYPQIEITEFLGTVGR